MTKTQAICYTFTRVCNMEREMARRISAAEKAAVKKMQRMQESMLRLNGELERADSRLEKARAHRETIMQKLEDMVRKSNKYLRQFTANVGPY